MLGFLKSCSKAELIDIIVALPRENNEIVERTEDEGETAQDLVSMHGSCFFSVESLQKRTGLKKDQGLTQAEAAGYLK